MSRFVVKIGDQKPVSPPLPGVDSASESAAPTTGSDFAQQLDDVEGASEAGSASPLGDIEALAARIEQGDIAPDEAMRLIVDRVLDAQLGADSPSALRDHARSFVQKALASDPHLIALTQRLGGGR
jgi:hypothetical protein